MKNKKIASILLAGTILASSTPVYTFAENGNETTPNTAVSTEIKKLDGNVLRCCRFRL